LNRTFGSPTDGKKWTISYWAKIGIIGRANHFAPNLSTNEGSISIESDFALYVNARVGTVGGAGTNYVLATTQVFRDPSAWYHIVVALDTTQATSSNRVKVYVNGTQVTAFSTANYPPQNSTPIMGSAVSHAIGRVGESGYEYYYDGLFGEFYYVDGQALTPSSFGSTNDQTGVWQPIAYTGTYGTNGFYLPFSNTASTATLGNDFSGNSNNWTTNNISLTTGTSIQTFSTTGTTSWTAPAGVTSVSYLVVAGGGGGGGYGGDNVGGGGGGAGGMRTGTLTVNPGTTYTVTVGAGGGPGTIGSDSVFSSITSTGGGRGGQPAGGNGGSGGGAGAATGSGSAIGLGTAGQGNNGALGFGDWGTTTTTGGGGGGAGGAGGAASGTTPGTGGAGSASSITGVSVTYAAGGAGAYGASSGGGTSGAANTGNGGQARGGQGGGSAGSGGSGIVILSWANGSTSTYDSMTDVPTQWIPYNTAGDTGALYRGNYCVLNPLDYGSRSTSTFGGGNLNVSNSNGGSADSLYRSTFGLSSGKWYFETVFTTIYNTEGFVGICRGADYFTLKLNSNPYYNGSLIYYAYRADGTKYDSGSATSYGATWTANDVIGVAFDADAGTIVFYKNGVSQGTAYSGLSGTWFPTVLNGGGNSAIVVNFGQRPFAYAPPSGFKTLNTTNLPTPTIGTTSTTQGNDYFNTVLYTGNGATYPSSQSITGVGFQPDFTWIKSRSNAYPNFAFDAVRGAGKELVTNDTAAETNKNQLTTFGSDGFSVAVATDGSLGTNGNGSTFVAWNWKANGAGSSNTSGSINSTVSANASAGFSIVTYTGSGSAATVGHGLGVAPSMIIVKDRDNGTYDWNVYHASLSSPTTLKLYLNTTDAETNGGTNSGTWNSTAPTSTVFSLGTFLNVNKSGDKFVAYCFAQVAGYSAFGKYTGNGSTDGPFVYTGFRPRFIMFKNTTTGATNWQINDAARDTYNVMNKRLAPSNGDAEATNFDFGDFLSNGFKIRQTDQTWNKSGDTYIYACFAESPFKYALAR
jgi:hypothetical protein